MTELDPHDAAEVAEMFVPGDGAGPPIPAFDGVMEEASFWADMASPSELDAYALATVTRMAPARRAAFLSHGGGCIDDLIDHNPCPWPCTVDPAISHLDFA